MSTEPDALTRRIERLAAASAEEPEGAAVAALVGALRTEIGGVRSRLGSLDAGTGAVRQDLDALATTLTTTLEQGRAETAGLAERVAELSGHLEAGFEQAPVQIRERLDELAARVDEVSAELQQTLGTGLERQRGDTAGTASAMEEARGALESRMAVLEDTLDAVSERIEALTKDGITTTVERLAGLSAALDRLDGQAAAERGQAGEREERAAERLSALESALVERLNAQLAERDQALRADLRGSLEAGRADAQQDRETVAELAVTVRGALDGFASALERSVAGLATSVGSTLAAGREEARSELGRLAERFGSTVDGLRAQLTERDEDSRSRIAELQGSTEGSARSLEMLQQAGERTEERLGALQSTAEAAVERVIAVQESAGETARTTEDRLGTLQAAGERAAAATDERLSAVQAAAVTAVERSSREHAAALSEVRDEVARGTDELTGRVDRIDAAASDAREALRGLHAEVGTSADAARDQLAEVAARTATAVEAAAEGLRDEVSSATGRLRDEVTGRVEQVERSVGEGLAQLRDDVATRLDELGTSVGARVLTWEAAFGARAGELQSTVTDGLSALGAEVGESTGRGREATERLAELTELVERQGADVATGLGSTRSELGAATDALRRELLERTAEQLDALRTRVDAVDLTLDQTSSSLAERLDGLDTGVERGSQTVERAVEGLAALRSSTGDLEETVRGFRDEWPTRTFEVVQGARAVAEGVVREVRLEVEAQLDRVRQELARTVGSVQDASGGLDDGTDRLARAGLALVGYLEQRDRLLEAERDRVLADVLDTFAAGLSSRERMALGGRVNDALSRRRDARDAQRYREVTPDPARPVVPELPEDVRSLLSPERPGLSSSDRSSEPGSSAGEPREPEHAESEHPSRSTTRTIAAAGSTSTPRREGTVVRGPGKVAAKPAPPSPNPQPPAPTRPASSARQQPAPRAQEPSAAGPARREAVSAPPDRRGRLDAMPEVPGPGKALDAAAPPPSGSQPSDRDDGTHSPSRPAPEGETEKS